MQFKETSHKQTFTVHEIKFGFYKSFFHNTETSVNFNCIKTSAEKII